MQDCKISLLGLKIRLLGLSFQTHLFRLFFQHDLYYVRYLYFNINFRIFPKVKIQ